MKKMISLLDEQMSLLCMNVFSIFELFEFEVRWILVAVSESVSINCIIY